MNKLDPTLRTMLVPFVLTLFLGGIAVVIGMGLSGLLPVRLNLSGVFAAQPESPSSVQRDSTVTPQTIDAAPPRPTATTLPPNPDDLTLICEANAYRYALAHPEGTLALAASRVLVPPGGEHVYILADGRLGRVPLEQLEQDTGLLVMLRVESPDRTVGGFPVQELVDLAYDDVGDSILALDKSGRLFRYSLNGETWSRVHEARLAPDNQADPSYLALSAANGTAFLLDADLNQVWRLPLPDEGDEASVVGSFSGALPGGTQMVDFVASGDVLLTLDTEGALRRFQLGDHRPTLEFPVPASLSLSLQARESSAYVVDGLARNVVAVGNDPDAPNGGYRFAFEGMGLLRAVAFHEEDRLLAVADGSLFAYPAPDPAGSCGQNASPSLPMAYYNVDLSEALAAFQYPIDDGRLPGVPRAYPGARRLYRAGVHHGLDVHPWDTPGGFDVGEPLRAMQDGIVTRADVKYQPVTNAEYNFLTEQALGLGLSLPATLDRIGGRQVFIIHTNGIETRYLHLDSITEGIAPGAAVKRGDIIGTVGVSGTGSEAGEVFVVAHAHVEIWVGEYYLGQGLSLRETMWLWQQVFPDLDLTRP